MSVDFDDAGFGGYTNGPGQDPFETSKLNTLMRACGVPKEYRIQFSIFLVVIVLGITGIVVYVNSGHLQQKLSTKALEQVNQMPVNN